MVEPGLVPRHGVVARRHACYVGDAALEWERNKAMPQKLGFTPEEINVRSLVKVTKRARQSVTLSHFMKEFLKKGKLSKSQRLDIINQALLLLEMNYAHLPFKRARHAFDPIQKLRRLKFALEQTKPEDLLPEMLFHHQMQQVFISTRDNHTSYSLPSPFKNLTAFLPFLIEEYFEKESRKPRYLVTSVATTHLDRHLHNGADAETFQPGVEVLYWNGIPITRAIELNGEKRAGSNYHARFARALDAMTIRPFNSSLPPDEEWVVITYRAGDERKSRDIKLEWRVFESKPDNAFLRHSAERVKRHVSLDPQKSATNYVRWILYQKSWEQKDKETKDWEPKDQEAKPFLSSTFRAKQITDGGESFAYIRILTFDRDDDEFRKELIHLIKTFTKTKLRQRGLIIDVRGNGGGCIEAGERVLQLLTPRRIEPASFQFLNTPMNLKVSQRADSFLKYDHWSASIAQAGDTGAIHSQALPITHEDLCNDIGQIYYGPTVLITDALCYSTTDIFAAGFEDNEIGEILGASGNTGAGGANVVKHKDLVRWMKFKGTPYKRLPKGMTMRVSLLRSLRVGKNADRPLEELGVKVDDRHRHYITKDDLLHDGKDLINSAVSILRSKPIHDLEVETKRKLDGTGTILAKTTNISRLDVYIDDHPYDRSRRVKKKGDKIELNHIPLAGRSPKLVIEGYSLGKLVARFMTRRWVRS